jgi:hypothetical protein
MPLEGLAGGPGLAGGTRAVLEWDHSVTVAVRVLSESAPGPDCTRPGSHWHLKYRVESIDAIQTTCKVWSRERSYQVTAVTAGAAASYTGPGDCAGGDDCPA